MLVIIHAGDVCSALVHHCELDCGPSTLFMNYWTEI